MVFTTARLSLAGLPIERCQDFSNSGVREGLLSLISGLARFRFAHDWFKVVHGHKHPLHRVTVHRGVVQLLYDGKGPLGDPLEFVQSFDNVDFPQWTLHIQSP